MRATSFLGFSFDLGTILSKLGAFKYQTQT